MKHIGLALAAVATLLGTRALAQPAPPTPPATTTTSPRVMMLRLYVADIDRGEKFYHAVFGTTTVQRMGDNVRILIFPGGTLPGIILIKSADEVTMNGSFVMQVPDLKGTMERAAANGGKLMNTNFADRVQGMPARSSHFIDLDGNIIEVLQMGGAK